MGPFSLGIWDEPGLLVKGHDHPPMVMMGHNRAEYEAWVERAGYIKARDLLTYDLDAVPLFRRWSSGSSPPARRTRASASATSTSRTSTPRPT